QCEVERNRLIAAKSHLADLLDLRAKLGTYGRRQLLGERPRGVEDVPEPASSAIKLDEEVIGLDLPSIPARGFGERLAREQMALVEFYAIFLGDRPTGRHGQVVLARNFAGCSCGFLEHSHIIKLLFVGWKKFLLRKEHLVCDIERPMIAGYQRRMNGIIYECIN